MRPWPPKEIKERFTHKRRFGTQTNLHVRACTSRWRTHTHANLSHKCVFVLVCLAQIPTKRCFLIQSRSSDKRRVWCDAELCLLIVFRVLSVDQGIFVQSSPACRTMCRDMQKSWNKCRANQKLVPLFSSFLKFCRVNISDGWFVDHLSTTKLNAMPSWNCTVRVFH